MPGIIHRRCLGFLAASALALPAWGAPAFGGDDRAWRDFKEVVGGGLTGLGVVSQLLVTPDTVNTGPAPKPEPVARPDRLPEARLKRYLDKHVARPVTTFSRKLSDKARDKAKARRAAAIARRTKAGRPS